MIGINSGINMVIAPMYLTEIAPVQYRGSFGTLSQFGVVTSLLLSQVGLYFENASVLVNHSFRFVIFAGAWA